MYLKFRVIAFSLLNSSTMADSTKPTSWTARLRKFISHLDRSAVLFFTTLTCSRNTMETFINVRKIRFIHLFISINMAMIETKWMQIGVELFLYRFGIISTNCWPHKMRRLLCKSKLIVLTFSLSLTISSKLMVIQICFGVGEKRMEIWRPEFEEPGLNWSKDQKLDILRWWFGLI